MADKNPRAPKFTYSALGGYCQISSLRYLCFAGIANAKAPKAVICKHIFFSLLGSAFFKKLK